MKKVNSHVFSITAAVIATSISLPCIAADNGWMLRLRGIDIIPAVSSSTITTIGGNVTHISNQIVPELDINYFFTRHIAAELILGTSRHNLIATNTILGTVNLGKVSLLPPTLTMQYHFAFGKFDPYLGLGVNYTCFYNATPSNMITGIRYSNEFAAAFQAGADFYLTDHWLVNVDAKKILLSTNASVDALGTTVTTNVKLNPWIVGLGVGYRF